MTVLRFMFLLGRNGIKGVTKMHSSRESLMHIFDVPVRNISHLEITKNLVLVSNRKLSVKPKQFQLNQQDNRPLVILLSWLMAKQKYIQKYAQFYLHHGFDILNINVSPWQMLWPTKGTQVVAADVLKFLEANSHYGPMVLHGFSIGGYVWGEVLVQIAAEQKRYQSIVDKISGQIWDSAADITEIPTGVPLAVFPKNAVMQSALKQYMLYHMKTFDKVATCHYVRSSQMFHTSLVKAPALFFLSKTDPVGAERSNQRVRENWENMGIQVFWKCWNKSPHVGHFRHHPEEYIGELTNFLGKAGLIAYPKKIQAKL